MRPNGKTILKYGRRTGGILRRSGISANSEFRFEFRDHNELPEYRKWENTALFLGPVISYRQEKWWAALTIAPQTYA
jgi:hypothetical protein